MVSLSLPAPQAFPHPAPIPPTSSTYPPPLSLRLPLSPTHLTELIFPRQVPWSRTPPPALSLGMELPLPLPPSLRPPVRSHPAVSTSPTALSPLPAPRMDSLSRLAVTLPLVPRTESMLPLPESRPVPLSELTYPISPEEPERRLASRSVQVGTRLSTWLVLPPNSTPAKMDRSDHGHAKAQPATVPLQLPMAMPFLPLEDPDQL